MALLMVTAGTGPIMQPKEEVWNGHIMDKINFFGEGPFNDDDGGCTIYPKLPNISILKSILSQAMLAQVAKSFLPGQRRVGFQQPQLCQFHNKNKECSRTMQASGN